MSLSEARTFLKARLKETDSSFREWKDGFNSQNIPSNIFNKAYHISYQQASINNIEHIIDTNISAEVLIFYKGYRNVQSAYDSAMNLSYKLKQKAVNPSKVTGSIKRVICDSVNIEPVDNNDNSFIIKLDFTLRMMFTTL